MSAENLVFLLTVLTINAKLSIAAKCEISIVYPNGDLKEPQPLLLTDSKTPVFILPNENRTLVVPSNTTILLACPGPKNFLQHFGSKQSVKATCVDGLQFSVDSRVHKFNDFICKRLPADWIQKSSSKCLNEHQQYEIGFKLEDKFLPQIELCRDETTFRTYYTKYKIAKEIDSFQSKYPRPFWKYGKYFGGYNMNLVFKAPVQLESVAKQLGSMALAKKYIRTSEQFLSRGHYVAKADVIFGAHQTVTFWHLNNAAQWSSFNAGNWMILETGVRNFIIARGKDTDVYTGVHGITTLTDVNGVQQPLYLFANGTNKAFPVPRFYWKIIQDPISKKATAFVGVNEPYAKNVTDDMFLCPDIGKNKKIPWLTWKPRDIVMGVSYICEVRDLRKAVPTIPDIGETGLLI